LAQTRRAAKVDQAVRLPVERVDALAGEAVVGVVDGIPIGPTVAEPVALHHPADVGDVVVALHHHAVNAGVVGVGATVLDVPDLVAEPLEAEDVLHGLPGDPAQGHLTDEVEDNDLAALAHVLDPKRYSLPTGSRDPSRPR